jgi:hypothetical protein
VASLVYLTTRAPSRLAQQVILAGHQVFEAADVSEAIYLCEHRRVDVIVIASDIDDEMVEAQLHHLTIRLKPEASAKELIWELSNLFPDKTMIQ